MGLDQYLYKRTYVEYWEHRGDDNVTTTAIHKGKQLSHIKPERVAYIIEEVGYWRKANQIHQWFVENVQNGVDDCGEYNVESSQLNELKEACKAVLKLIKDGDVESASEILPTSSGFFFGSTDYDEYYIADIKDTIKIIDNCLAEAELAKEHNGFVSFAYRSSW